MNEPLFRRNILYPSSEYSVSHTEIVDITINGLTSDRRVTFLYIKVFFN